ncbi:PrsW family glutamic-type intramembrane protease [Leptospira sarikeiensis]|uniref:PrsW family intramembrane metalloprotease n=1 Tax=Leptospira sarikeiensis TaxID=2484943 RepID=A0A4R9KFR5_9LEPT|nr:PrsW family glutamic-type intramembrane protease [Leptospira sarikeiensis]TGL64123.1 PrsW family intramembrane metalloprotease [Leptospira sarikeiensis]
MEVFILVFAVISILPWGFFLVYTQPNSGRDNRIIFIILFALLLGWLSTELVLKTNALFWPEADIKTKVSKHILSEIAFMAFVKAGMLEELFKSLLILMLALVLSYDWKLKVFLPETFLVGGFVSLGFAGIENYHYIFLANEGGQGFDNVYKTFILRTLKSSNAHLLINLCFSMFLIKSNKKKFPDKYWYIFFAFLLAVIQHGLFDFFVIPIGRFGYWAATALFVGIWVWIVRDRRIYMSEGELFKIEKETKSSPEVLKPSEPEIIR